MCTFIPTPQYFLHQNSMLNLRFSLECFRQGDNSLVVTGTPISTTPFVRNPMACQALCVAEDNCFYFNFYSNGGFCLLFDIYAMAGETADGTSNNGITSGPRICSESPLKIKG